MVKVQLVWGHNKTVFLDASVQLDQSQKHLGNLYLHVNGYVRAKSGGRWSRSAGSRSPQRLEWSVHGISVIKRRWSLTTEIVKSSFNCRWNWRSIRGHSSRYILPIMHLHVCETTTGYKVCGAFPDVSIQQPMRFIYYVPFENIWWNHCENNC